MGCIGSKKKAHAQSTGDNFDNIAPEINAQNTPTRKLQSQSTDRRLSATMKSKRKGGENIFDCQI